jgi:hypothetical protein
MALLNAFLRENGCTGLQHGENHQIWWVPVKIFNQLPIKQWKFNRPPDTDRIAEIHQHIVKAKRVDGIVYLADVEGDIVCYESNHRREALKGVSECADILIDIMWRSTDEDVKEEFFRLNKCVPVPDLYVSREVVVEASQLIAARDTFCKKYAMLKSTSANPHRPGFNPEGVLNDFLDITKIHKITVDELMKRLDKVNAQLATRNRKKLSENVIEKCEKSGLWLYAWNKRLNVLEFA